MPLLICCRDWAICSGLNLFVQRFFFDQRRSPWSAFSAPPFGNSGWIQSLVADNASLARVYALFQDGSNVYGHPVQDLSASGSSHGVLNVFFVTKATRRPFL